jgi:hypothetical protein
MESDKNRKENAMSEQKDTSATKELELAKKQGANLLIPTTNIHGLSEFMTPVIDSVYLSQKQEDGDVYPEKSAADAKLRISAQGLRKLAVASGIMWHPRECKRTDNRQDKDYVSFQAVGSIKKNDGTMVAWKGEFDLDLQVVEEELRELYYQKSKSWHKSDAEKKAYIESSVRRDLLQKRKHKIKLAETGAMNRVIRAILGLKSAYSKAELAKPFVVVRIVFQPDLSDPETKRQVTTAAIQAMTGIYGAQPATLPPPIDVPPEDYEINEVPPEDEDPPPPDEGQAQEEGENGEAPTGEEVFESMSAGEQVETLTQMAKARDYKPKQPTKNLGPKDRLSFFAALEKMPELEKAQGRDIPY